MTTALEGGEGSASRPVRSLRPGRTRYPLYTRLGGPQDRSGQVWKISLPPAFDPRTVQPVASRYTDYATRPTNTVSDTWYEFGAAACTGLIFLSHCLSFSIPLYTVPRKTSGFIKFSPFRHDSVKGSGGKGRLILNLGIRWR